jgi:hypothetical protein
MARACLPALMNSPLRLFRTLFAATRYGGLALQAEQASRTERNYLLCTHWIVNEHIKIGRVKKMLADSFLFLRDISVK